MRFPYSHSGIVKRLKMPSSMPKIPNGSAGPFSATQSATKNVQANEITDRRIVTMTKQSPARCEYESMSFQKPDQPGMFPANKTMKDGKGRIYNSHS